MHYSGMFWWLTVSLLLTAIGGDIHIGGALNIFQYFGDLNSIMEVDPQQERKWFSNNDSVDIFEEVLETRSPSLPVDEGVFNGDFQLELCDNLAQLKEAYFRHFKIAGSEKPWRIFTGGWTNAVLARHLGLNSSYVTGSYGYVLVRLTRKHELVRLTPHISLRVNNWTANRMDYLVPGQVNSVLEFIRVSGSHYVSSYMTGDSLYQVFVFSPAVYSEMQRVMEEHEASSLRLNQMLSFFTPWHVEQIGHIRCTSGNGTLERWAAQNLQSHVFIFSYSSLLNLHTSPELLQVFNHLLGNNALIAVDLQTLTPLFRDVKKRQWFEEVLDNQMKVWELNI